MTLRCLDLFSGTGGWSEAFLQRGHDVLRIDNDEQFMHVPWTSIEDVLTFRPREQYDVVLASPPCQAFSLAATGTHMAAYSKCVVCGDSLRKTREKWTHETISGCTGRPDGSLRLEPITPFGKLSVALVDRTLALIDTIKPRYWWMENPNGGMIHFVPKDILRVQTTYCQYGERRQKLTNLWGRWPEGWTARPRCRNGAKCPDCSGVGATDHAEDGTFGIQCARCGGSGFCHEPAPRGAKTGTQGISGARDRAIVPYELSLEVCLAVERAV